MPNVAGTVLKLAGKLRLDAKRTGSERVGTQGWFPYYAGYAGGFVEELLSGLSEAGPLRVLDPWNGSGTTTSIAHRLGHTAFGFDINPVLSIVSAAKLAHPEDALHVTGLARRLASTPARLPGANDPLLAWLGPSSVAQYRGIEGTLLAELASTPSGTVLEPGRDGLPPLAAFLLLALIRTARSFASVKHGSNPTWIRPSEERRRSGRNFGSRWVEHVAAMAEDLNSSASTAPPRAWNGELGVADCRSLPLSDDSVDVVLTSPPYCTRIDYIVSASFELAALGVAVESAFFEKLRRTSMGTPLSRTQDLPSTPSGWPDAVRGVLTRIQEHPSKASHAYYFRTYWQYFDDVMKSLREIHRVVRGRGAAVLVVQSSYYKEIPVDLPELYVDCARAVGFEGQVASAVEVRRAMSQINPHSRKHRAEKHYREAVVVLERLS